MVIRAVRVRSRKDTELRGRRLRPSREILSEYAKVHCCIRISQKTQACTKNQSPGTDRAMNCTILHIGKAAEKMRPDYKDAVETDRQRSHQKGRVQLPRIRL